MSNHDPRTKGPGFRGKKKRSYSLQDHNQSEERGFLIGNDHHFRLPHHHGNNTNPLHNAAGKPLKRHGTETIGDVILHPFKEFQLHHKREEAYAAEKRKWNENHPEAIASDMDVEHLQGDHIVDDVQRKIVIHCRYLFGNKALNMTEEKLQELKEPLELSEEEMKLMSGFNDMDQITTLFEKSERNFSLKVYRAIDLRRGKKDDSDLRESMMHGDNNRSNKTPIGSSSEIEKSEEREKEESKHMVVKGEKDDPNDVFIELNDNVYLQIMTVKPLEEHESQQRRAFFIVPSPDLSDDIGEESAPTWVELLGDVFYVGWLSNFTHATEIESADLIGKYVAWFVVMWWTWCSSALYASRYDSGDVVHHIYKIIELCGLIIMAGSSPTYDTSPRWFIIGYIIMKAVLLVQYSAVLSVSLGAHFKSSRRPLGIYVAASAISIIMWGISLLYVSSEDMAKRYVLWYLSIGLELIVHLFLQTNSRVSLGASHLGERFGLFTLIILGENCMGFISKVAEIITTAEANTNPDPSVMAAIMFGVAIIFCYFFMYFDDFSGEFVEKTKLSSIWMYLHFPLHLVQVAFGIALTNLVDALSQHTAEEEEQVFIVKFFWVTAGLILCFNAFIKLVNTPVKGAHHRSHIICASRILNAIIFFALSATTFEQLGPLSMISIMMACLFIQSAVDLLD